MFDPAHLTPEISLNRVQIIRLPGLDPDIAGKTGYQLVSSAALAALLRDHAAALRLDAALDDHPLNLAFDACLEAASPVFDTARQVARQFGRRLGFVLLALRRGDEAQRAVRSEWTAAHWDHWAGIRQVILGGGVVSGRLGPLMVDHAFEVLRDAGLADMTLRLSPYQAALPLVGMARRAPAEVETALVFDFGGTRIKRGLAHYRAGDLVRLDRLADRPSITPAMAALDDRDLWAAALFDHMLAVILDSRAQAGSAGSLPVLASLSAYMRDNHPLQTQRGLYTELARLTENVGRTLAERLSASTGQIVTVALEHDGTAAALAHAGSPRTAVIPIGTALGIGFAPEAAGLRGVKLLTLA
jgi:hypothetical protein